MDLKSLYEAVTSELSKVDHKEYLVAYNSETVKSARSAWMKAAVETDNARLYFGENSEEHLKAKDIETIAHEAYLSAKEHANILGKNNKE